MIMFGPTKKEYLRDVFVSLRDVFMSAGSELLYDFT